MEQQKNEMQAVINTAQAAVGVQYVAPFTAESEGVPVVAVPAGGRAEVLDLEKHLPSPARTTGKVTLRDLASFARYADRHRGDGTTLWVDVAERKVTAVLNDHEPTASAWGDHRALLALELTEEWNRWVGADGRLMSQEEFAQLIEEGQREIVEPAAAEMLELAQTFYVTSSANFHSGIEIQSGTVRFRYDEDQQASAGSRGDLAIPREFCLALPPFVGEPAYEIKALFKWRRREGQLLLGFKLDRPRAVLEHAMDEVARQLRAGVEVDGEKVAESFPQVYMGAPRS